MIYRNLTVEEIISLEKNGCRAENWSLIQVKEGFLTDKIKSSVFIGENQLGCFGRNGDGKEPTGIFHSIIQDCLIEDHVFINQVGRINNYLVRSHAKIEHTSLITANGLSLFGNGIEIACINEAGGREVMIYDQLSAPIAWMMAFLRHSSQFISHLKDLIRERILQNKEEKGVVGHHSHIVNCHSIENVKIGDYAILHGVSSIQNGTIVSDKTDPAYVGPLVIASDFIIQKGSKVSEGTILKHCFIGESCEIERQFSAENTLVFANSQLYHGEACSVFAAPYTVSHHKSSLLIAGYFSFANFGSGSNQSNHMYKLGPVHQGIVERGCKFASDSYVLWPAKIGPFTFVSGHHYSNPDTSCFPFSNLTESNGISYLSPGAVLRSIGTIRDAQKWPNRDKRKGSRMDPIHYKLLSPYTISKIVKGNKALIEMEFSQKADSGSYLLSDVKIKKSALKRGKEVYSEVLTIFAGDLLFSKFGNESSEIEQMMEVLSRTESELTGDWVDLAGLFVPKVALSNLILMVENGLTVQLSAIEKQLVDWVNAFSDLEYDWFVNESFEITGFDFRNLTSSQLKDFMARYRKSLLNFHSMLLRDAQKEFSEKSKTGFGFDDSGTYKQDDFFNVRGNMDSNSFIKEMTSLIEPKLKWIDHLH